MSDDGAVVVVGGTRAIGRELVRHYVQQGRQVVLTGQSAENVAAAVAEHGEAVRGVTFDLAEPHTIAAALADVGPVDRLALVAIDRDQNRVDDYDIDRAIRLVTLKLVGYTTVVSTLRAAAVGVRVDRAVRRHGQGAPVSGIDHGHHRQRRRRRADADARRGAAAGPGELDPPRRRRRQPLLVGQAGGDREVHRPRRPPDASWRCTRSSTPPCSCSRTAGSTASS